MLIKLWKEWLHLRELKKEANKVRMEKATKLQRKAEINKQQEQG